MAVTSQPVDVESYQGESIAGDLMQ